jgi:hypothetical protein
VRSYPQWRRNYPQYVEYERQFWAARKVEMRVARTEKRRRRADIQAEFDGPSTLDPESYRWYI